MLYSLQATEFAAGKEILNILQNYQCSTVEHSDAKESIDRPAEKVKDILSAAFEKKVGGLKSVVELVKKRSAKSIVILKKMRAN